jgi:hypothetical protein
MYNMMMVMPGRWQKQRMDDGSIGLRLRVYDAITAIGKYAAS